MNTRKRRPVTLIVADAEPLISLACADELRLLQLFGRPVAVTDVVREECTRKTGAPGQDILSRWFEAPGRNQFRKLRTPFLSVFVDALSRERSGEDPHATQGHDDASISWILKNLNRLKDTEGKPLQIEPDGAALVLTEDGP